VAARTVAASARLQSSPDNLAPVTELVSSQAEAYAEAHTTGVDGQLAEVASWTQSETSVPQMMSGLAEARLLEALIVASGARHVLEIGTFTGFGALTMAAALPDGGRVTTLEVDEETAAVARRHIDGSPHASRIELIVGNALDTIERLPGPFDLVYIDAGKAEYPAYYEAVMGKLSERGVIVADNLFRAGLILDTGVDDAGTQGMREFTRRVHEDERVHNVLLTIGDGVMLAWRRPAGG
jgi:caffeoyl-CoA O-methyltransferase